MYTPAPDEKMTPVMVYTRESVFRGEVVTKQNVRVSTWLRTQGAPRYIHLFGVSAVQFSGAVKSFNSSEVFIPLPMVTALHLTPPGSDGVDYDPQEANRAMLPILAGVGTFQFKGVIRVSAQSGIGPSLELSKIPWMSLYELEITNPLLPQMPAMHVPLAVVNPEQVTFAIP